MRLRWTNTVRNFVLWRWIVPWGRGSETRSACTGCDAEGVSCDTGEMFTGYRCLESSSNSTLCDACGRTPAGHHVRARSGAARRRGQGPKPRSCTGAVGAQRRGLDGAEAQLHTRLRDGRRYLATEGAIITTLRSLRGQTRPHAQPQPSPGRRRASNVECRMVAACERDHHSPRTSLTGGRRSAASRAGRVAQRVTRGCASAAGRHDACLGEHGCRHD